MSFNLNKNDGRVKPVKKSGFDLSKSAGPAEAEKNATSQGPKWWLIGLAVLLAGGGAWYFTGNKAGTDIPQTGTATMVQQNSTDSVARDTMRSVMAAKEGQNRTAKVKTDGISPDVNAAVVAASYEAGAVQPVRVASVVIKGIKKKLAGNSSIKISVLGYASSEGSLQVNQRISQERADAFKRVLIRRGVAENQVTADGRGIENPIATNDTEEGRRKNRRVEVVVPKE